MPFYLNSDVVKNNDREEEVAGIDECDVMIQQAPVLGPKETTFQACYVSKSVGQEIPDDGAKYAGRTVTSSITDFQNDVVTNAPEDENNASHRTSQRLWKKWR